MKLNILKQNTKLLTFVEVDLLDIGFDVFVIDSALFLLFRCLYYAIDQLTFNPSGDNSQISKRR